MTNDCFSPKTQQIENAKPLVIMSACLQGERVRYDGQDKSLSATILNVLQTELQLIRFCPEVAAGMGVPRAPVHWVERPDQRRELQQVGNPQRLFHTPLQEACQQWCDQLQQRQYQPLAAILKARSPSCGHGTTPLLNEDQEVVGSIDGAWVSALKGYFPTLLMIDERYLSDRQSAIWFCRLLQQSHSSHESLSTGMLELLALPETERLNWWQNRYPQPLY